MGVAANNVAQESLRVETESLHAEIESLHAEIEAAERMVQAASLLPTAARMPETCGIRVNANLGRPFVEFDEDREQEQPDEGEFFHCGDDNLNRIGNVFRGRPFEDMRPFYAKSATKPPYTGSNSEPVRDSKTNGVKSSEPVVECLIEDGRGNIINGLRAENGQKCSDLTAQLLANEPNRFDRFGVDEKGNSEPSFLAALRDFVYAFGRRATVHGNNRAVFVDGTGVRHTLADGDGNPIYYNPLSGKYFANDLDLEIKDAMIFASLGAGGTFTRVPLRKIVLNTGGRSSPKWKWGYGNVKSSEADEAYDALANSVTDVDAIARNMNLGERSKGRLEQIKNYLFRRNNDIPNFASDPAIATAWHRMRTGASAGLQRQSDLLFLKHEVAELWLKKKFPDLSHYEAHRKAQSKYNWNETVPWTKFEE